MASVIREAIASCVLSDTSIEELMAKGANVVDPFEPKLLQPASLDLRLGSSTYSYKLESYTLGEAVESERVQRGSFNTLTLEAGQTAFVGLYERISIPRDMMGIVFPRSSITRLGIQIQTVYMNPGYVGILPLTITNNIGVPLTLSPGKRVAQLVLISLGATPQRVYKNVEDSKYYQENADSSQLHTDQELEERVDATFRRHFKSLFD